MKRRNGALIYNILPPHVAAYFLSRARHHDDLYSQSYADVGVLFASMPNFADFYSEESINNQGLECLRFLNEVISDFDAILDQTKFKDIIKIKTIGSTYMAASGITESAESEDTARWGHLSTLVEFALELKKALSSINEQSFNHFVLKMVGINHGPVTAGVIGARKPHYDIWGNTVNVASRMESTGKVGCIQVTDETRKILEPFGFGFEQRGLVFVKGKGQLLTHYLVSKDGVSLNLDSDLPFFTVTGSDVLQPLWENTLSATGIERDFQYKIEMKSRPTYRSRINSHPQHFQSNIGNNDLNNLIVLQSRPRDKHPCEDSPLLSNSTSNSTRTFNDRHRTSTIHQWMFHVSLVPGRSNSCEEEPAGRSGTSSHPHVLTNLYTTPNTSTLTRTNTSAVTTFANAFSPLSVCCCGLLVGTLCFEARPRASAGNARLCVNVSLCRDSDRE
ncbi:Adenylate cyclase type 3 [Melipona quadrifasciata]|uniref:adenylate cyclase n=1 Tax=Melipona quadrifasciata TaxID=166423 RepID=A0A0N0BFJ0_9HYME|nr:Adenylate cyclase type 3 [Melipona quadrifasciata]